MKRYQAALGLVLVCAFAQAGELEEGMNAWERKDFAQAYKVFSKLAAAGNAEAQRQLGEMYGFGEGVPENLDEARRWIEQSRARGNKAAAESLALVEQRAAHKADIARYTTHYDGSDVALARFNCDKPEIPSFSDTKKKISAVSGKIAKWYECYGEFAANLKAQLPAGKAIPQQTAQLMNAAEFAQAQALMDKTYARVAEEAKREADQISNAEDKWIAACERAGRNDLKVFMVGQNDIRQAATEGGMGVMHKVNVGAIKQSPVNVNLNQHQNQNQNQLSAPR